MARASAVLLGNIANPNVGQPVSAYISGRAQKMAYEQDKLRLGLMEAQIQGQQMQNQLAPLELQRRLRALALDEAELAYKRDDLALRQAIEANSNNLLFQDADGYYLYTDKKDPNAAAQYLTRPDGSKVPGPKSQPGYQLAAEGAGMAAQAEGGARYGVGRAAAYRDRGETTADALRQLRIVRRKIADAVQKTGVTGNWREVVDKDLQVLNGIFNGIFMDRYIQAKAGGATFGALNVQELELLKSLAPRIRNQPEANLQIIDNEIARMERSYQASADRYNMNPISWGGLEMMPDLQSLYGDWEGTPAPTGAPRSVDDLIGGQ